MASNVEKLNSKDFIRDPDYVKSKLVLKDNKLITTEELDIYVPHRFTVSDLLVIAETISTIGLFPMVIDNKYTVCSVNAMIPINPSRFRKVDIDGSVYYQFHFDKDTIVFTNTNLVKSDSIIYPLFREIVGQGQVPWYINYIDYGKLFDTSKEFANSPISNNPALMYVLTSMQSRYKENRETYYRLVINNYTDITSNPPDFIKLSSVVFSAGSTVNKIAGSYYKDGVISALSNPSTRVERLESLLKA